MALTNTGKSPEDVIRKTADAYERAGIMTLSKVEPPNRIIGWGPNKKVIHLENPFLDFVGSWTARGGRAVFVEVKSTAEHRLPIARDSGVTIKQIQALLRWQSAGAAVGVLWTFNDAWAFVSVATINNVIRSAEASLQWEDETIRKLGQGTGFVLVDFESALLEVNPPLSVGPPSLHQR